MRWAGGWRVSGRGDEVVCELNDLSVVEGPRLVFNSGIGEAFAEERVETPSGREEVGKVVRLCDPVRVFDREG